jgi:murein DD-endopeptidase MepM/ murein hydrolase activator NlpD
LTNNGFPVPVHDRLLSYIISGTFMSMKMKNRSTFGKPDPGYRPEVTGPVRYILIVLFLFFCLACISVDFYFFEQALFWADPPLVTARPPAPAQYDTFELGPRVFFTAIIEEGVSRADANAVVVALKDVEFSFNTLRPSQKITLKRDARERLLGLHYRKTIILSYSVRRLVDGSFIAEKKQTQTVSKTVVIAGRVVSTVWDSILSIGEKPSMTAKFIEIFGWDIDFSSDTRRGDSFVMILDKIYTENGELVGYGKLHAGQYDGSYVKLKRGFFVDHPVEKKKGFYSDSGQQMKKFMLRAPLDSLRVSSRFGFRMHPTIKKRKKHNGIDYRAPTGTPVWAVADGKVVSAGRKGAAGKMISIDHGEGVKSYYMHLSRILVKKGQRVSQRKLIGRVGSTGRSTGPHLHFGLKHKGRWTNPKKRSFGKVENLDKEYMPLIEQAVEKYGAQLDQAKQALPELPSEPVTPEKDDDSAMELNEPLS